MIDIFRCMTTLFRDAAASPRPRRRSSHRQAGPVACALHCETLENRQLLSATGFGVDVAYGVEVTSDITYRSDAQVGFGTPEGVSFKDLKLDLYTPVGEGLPSELPAAILIHGGGFTGGDKAQQNFVDLANDFASRGYVTVSINYRLVGDNPPPALPNPPLDDDPRYDAIVAGIEDVLHAIDWMKSSAESLNIDPERIVLGGHSAGGFLSMYAGMVDAPDLVGLTDISLDISSLDVAAVLDGAGGINGQQHTIDPDDPATFILHSTDDATVSIDEANTIAAELAANGVAFEFPVITDAGHGLDTKLDTVVDGTTARQQMFEFFEEQLDLEGLFPVSWSISTTSPHIYEDASGSESVIYSLSGVVAEGEQASVQLNLQDITTDPTDYGSVGLDLLNAVNAYAGPGTLTFDGVTGVLTYTGGVGGTAMSDLVVAMNVVDDEDFEYTESLEVSMLNAIGSTVDVEKSLIRISILDDDGTALDRYVAKPDATYDYELIDTIVEDGMTTYVIDMTSQTWRSLAEVDRPEWEHEVHIFVPDGATSDTAVLYVGAGDNGDPNQAIRRADAEAVAQHTGQITVYLPTVPNQYLTFTDDGIARREDAIMAYSFNKYLNGGDDEWPVLLPMVKSAVRAMDMTQEFLANNTTHTVSDFFVTGGSKRGWTTYLTAAADPRVSSITPVVFDYVNAIPTLEFHQHVLDGVTEGTVGGYAETLQSYVELGVFDQISSPEFVALGDMIDPYSYLDRLTMPKFAVLSTGDQFMPMASQFYIHDFEGPTYLRYIPNTGHEAGRQEGKGFFKAVDAGEVLPEYDWTVEGAYNNTIRLNTVSTPVEVNLWQATNLESLDFRNNYFGPNWTSSTLTDQGGGEYVATVLPPVSGGTAFMIEMKYDVGGEILTFTTEARIVEGITREWSVSGSSLTIAEDDPGSESLIVSLSGVFAEGEEASVAFNLQNITTNADDYQDPVATLLAAIADYEGAGSLSFDSEAGALTYTGGAGGTSMSDLLIPVLTVDDDLIEGDESLSLVLLNPTNAQLGTSEQSLTILDDDQTVELVDGELKVIGNDLADSFRFHVVNGGADLRVRHTPEGLPQQDYFLAAGDVTSIVVITHGGDDYVSFNRSVTVGATIDGGAGNDTLLSSYQDDIIVDMAGNNTIRSRSGNDDITTGDGDDDINAGGGNDVIHSGGGTDLIAAGSGADLVLAGAGDDTVSGGGGNDILVGGSGGDILLGGGSRDILIGGSGLDDLQGQNGKDLLIGDSTVYDDNEAALLAIMAEWSASTSQANRQANLSDGSGNPPGLNGFYYFNDSTIDDDEEDDLLDGGTGQNWLIGS